MSVQTVFGSLRVLRLTGFPACAANARAKGLRLKRKDVCLCSAAGLPDG